MTTAALPSRHTVVPARYAYDLRTPQTKKGTPPTPNTAADMAHNRSSIIKATKHYYI